jgi:hypothetical protein
MAITALGTGDFPRGRGGNFKPLVNKEDFIPRTGEILNVDQRLLFQAVSTAVLSGCALLISPTSDGGALSVTLYAGQQRHRAYATSSAEFEATLKAVEDVATAHTMGGPANRQNGPLQAS